MTATAQLTVTGRPDDVRTIVHAIRDGEPVRLTLVREPHELDRYTVRVCADATVETPAGQQLRRAAA